MSKKLRKGFTIIELIVVIALLGILVLLALPKFLGYTEKAKVSQVKNDIVAYEKAIDTKRIDDDKYIKDWEEIDVPTMESLKKSLFNKKGLIDSKNEVTFKGEYYKIPENSKLVKTSLKGYFYLGQGGEVYYYDEKLANKINGGSSTSEPPVAEPEPEPEPEPPVTEPEPPVVEPEPEPEPEPPVVDLPGPFKVTFKDYYGEVIETKTVEKGASVTAPVNPVTGLKIDKWDKDLKNVTADLEVKPLIDGPTDRELGYSNADFTWIDHPYNDSYIGLKKSKSKGYFKYTGKGRSTVEIPHVIQGVPMTSYYRMFYESPAEAYKVVSTNKNVTNMKEIFSYSKATSLDVSELDTSNVTDMSSMFNSLSAMSLDVSSLDTSNAVNMSAMFYASKVENITFGGKFNTSKVTDMSLMFYASSAKTLDLSSFDISNNPKMLLMFYRSLATTGYAKTQEDANKFNSTSDKPAALRFVVKNL